MTLADSIHSQRLHVLRQAIRLGNVSEACRRHGMSRTLSYRLRQQSEEQTGFLLREREIAQLVEDQQPRIGQLLQRAIESVLVTGPDQAAH